ncbi:MAG TPA: DNA glycosylase [Hyphomicrobiales bacterium]|nr:DNA glycosylase [Hyphomicrobiales bacterium]
MLYQPSALVRSDFAAFACPQDELDLEHTLASGQAFRWKKDREGWWACALDVAIPGNGAGECHSPPKSGHIIMRLWQDREQVFYQTHPASGGFQQVREYFRLDTDLPALEAGWRRRGGQEIAQALESFSGLRVLRQDPVECLFSFLCSPAAPIHRIRRSLDSLCRTLGVPLGEVAGVEHFAFPRVEHLAEASVGLLNKMGLGFRSENIRGTARELLAQGGASWLRGLRQVPYEDAKRALMAFPGVGAKVADCVCLFSLDKDEAVPIDVHMARVAKRLFPSCRRYNSLTKNAYAEASDCFRQRFGPHAGWAQQYLYYNELVQTGLWDEELGRHRKSGTKTFSK